MRADHDSRKVASVNSVDRAISILQVLARLGPSRVTDLATATQIHKSTVFRLLATLEGRGLVEQSTSRGRYQIAYGVAQIAVAASRRHDLAVISRPVCEALAEAVGETVDVAVTDGIDVTAIDQVLGVRSLTSVNWLGTRTPMHATSSGKVFLADMTPAQLQEVIDRGLPRFTEHTITAPDDLRLVVDQVREQGYAFTSGEHEIGYAAVTAPIRELSGQVVATLTVSGPEFRINAETLPAVVPLVLDAAAAISERNGYPRAG